MQIVPSHTWRSLTRIYFLMFFGKEHRAISIKRSTSNQPNDMFQWQSCRSDLSNSQLFVQWQPYPISQEVFSLYFQTLSYSQHGCSATTRIYSVFISSSATHCVVQVLQGLMLPSRQTWRRRSTWLIYEDAQRLKRLHFSRENAFNSLQICYYMIKKMSFKGKQRRKAMNGGHSLENTFGPFKFRPWLRDLSFWSMEVFVNHQCHIVDVTVPQIHPSLLTMRFKTDASINKLSREEKYHLNSVVIFSFHYRLLTNFSKPAMKLCGFFFLCVAHMQPRQAVLLFKAA